MQNFAAYERKDMELQENMIFGRSQIDKFKVNNYCTAVELVTVLDSVSIHIICDQ